MPESIKSEEETGKPYFEYDFKKSESVGQKQIDVREYEGNTYLDMLLGEEEDKENFLRNKGMSECEAGKTYDFKSSECEVFPVFDYAEATKRLLEEERERELVRLEMLDDHNVELDTDKECEELEARLRKCQEVRGSFTASSEIDDEIAKLSQYTSHASSSSASMLEEEEEMEEESIMEKKNKKWWILNKIFVVNWIWKLLVSKVYGKQQGKKDIVVSPFKKQQKKWKSHFKATRNLPRISKEEEEQQLTCAFII